MPARKPTALKEQKGTLQPCRTNPHEPQVDLGVPEAPEHLSGRAAAVFPRVAKMLFDMGVLTVADGFALEGLCQAYADWREAVEFLDRMGKTVYVTTRMAPDGSEIKVMKAFPQVAERNEADKRMRAWLQSCGLTPADRSRVSAMDKKQDNPWGDLIQ